MDEQLCKKCGRMLAPELFSKGTSACKECKKSYLRKYYADNAEWAREYARSYGLAHRDQKEEYKRAYRSIPENRAREMKNNREARRRRQYGPYAEALVVFMGLEKELRENEAVLAAVPERRHAKRHRLQQKRKKENRLVEDTEKISTSNR